jgi:hypothetical protein
MMLQARPRQADSRNPVSSTLAIDAAGRLWRHDNPAELYRWVSRRNDLLRTIAGAPRVAASRPR